MLRILTISQYRCFFSISGNRYILHFRQVSYVDCVKNKSQDRALWDTCRYIVEARCFLTIFYLEDAISQVRVQESIVSVRQISFYFIQETFMPYFFKGLLEVQQGRGAVFLAFQSTSNSVIDSVNLFCCSLSLSEPK